jgi:DHA3 family tetracycline resistance protein-like MFS transporter
MLLSDGLRGLLAVAVAALALNRSLEVWHVCVISALLGAINAFFSPAYTALIPEVTPTELLPSANALTSLSVELSGVAGPTVAALVVASGGPATAFGLDALSFVISATCLLPLLRHTRSDRPGPRAAGLLHDIHEGFRTVAQAPWLWFTLGILALLNLTGRSPMNVSLPFLVQHELKAEILSLGALYSMFSLGSIAGALAVGRLPTLHRRGVVVYAGLTAVGVTTAAVGLAPSILVVAAVILLLGAALSVSNLTWSNVLQDRIEARLLGRVASINLLSSTSLLPVGFVVVGRVTDALGASATFLWGGVLTALLAGMGLVIPSIRSLD